MNTLNTKFASTADVVPCSGRSQIGRTYKKFAVVTAIVAGIAVAAVAAPAAAAGGWVYQQLDTDTCYDEADRDSNSNGYYDDMWFDIDNDCHWDTNLYNSAYSDNLLETVLFDMNEDGRWEIWLADTNQKVGFEVAYFDYNGDGRSDRSLSLAPTATTVDLFAAINANNGFYNTSVSPFSQFKAALSGSMLG